MTLSTLSRFLTLNADLMPEKEFHTIADLALLIDGGTIDYDNPGNVLNFGADPTGAADSTANFQAAEDSGYEVFVPSGSWRIDGTINLDKPTVWKFQQGTIPVYRYWANTSQSTWDPDAPGQCRLFKDNSSTHAPFFKIRWGWVYLLGYPLLDVSDRDSFTTDGILYPMAEANPIVEAKSVFAYPRVWGGRVEIQCLGNDDTIRDLGEGMHCIHVDWGTAPIDTNLDNGYTTKLEWDVLAQNVMIMAEIDEKVTPPDQWSNSGFCRVRGHGVKRAVSNQGTNGFEIRGYLQASHILHPDERDLPCLYFANCTGNNWDFDFHDFGGDESGGSYRQSKEVEDYTYSPYIKEWDEGRPSEIERHGLKFRNQRNPYSTSSGIVDTYHTNNIANISVRAERAGGDFSWGVFKGVNIGGNTAVSDCVFSNQSGASVDITSALGALPTFVVGSRFWVVDHSEEHDNAEFIVTAVITDGYTCDKIRKKSYFWDPVDSGAEAVTITEDIGSLVTDSVTASIPTSSDYSLPGSGDPEILTHSWADDWCSIEFEQQAVDDVAYLEYHWTEPLYTADNMLAVYDGRTKFSKVQFIRFNTSGEVIDNVIFDAPHGGGTAGSPPIVHQSDMSGSNGKETIVRFFGPQDADEIINLLDLAAMSAEWSNAGHLVTQKGQHRILGPVSVDGHFQPPIVTSAQLNDVADPVNTSAWKIQGSMVFNSDLGVPVFADGDADSDVWKNAAGTTVNTPV